MSMNIEQRANGGSHDQTGLPRNRDGRVSWESIKEKPLDEMKGIIQEEAKMRGLNGYFSDYSLRDAGLAGFFRGVRKVYPGGVLSLRSDLGFETPTQRTTTPRLWTTERIETEARNYLEEFGEPFTTTPRLWTTERIETEARNYLEEFGEPFTTGALRTHGHTGLLKAVIRYYPDSLIGIRGTLGLVNEPKNLTFVQRESTRGKRKKPRSREYFDSHINS